MTEARSEAQAGWESTKVFGVLPMPWLSPFLRKTLESTAGRWVWQYAMSWPWKFLKNKLSRKES